MAAPKSLDLKQVMQRAKKEPLNFGLSIPKKKDQPPVLVVQKNKAAKQLAKAAKTESGNSRGICGMLKVNKKELELTCEEGRPTNAMAKRLRLQLKESGFKHKVVLIGADGKRLDDGEGDDGEDEGRAQVATKVAGKAQPRGRNKPLFTPPPVGVDVAQTPAGPATVPIPYPDIQRRERLLDAFAKLEETIEKLLPRGEPKREELLDLIDRRRSELDQDDPDFKKLEAFAKQLGQWVKDFSPKVKGAPVKPLPAPAQQSFAQAQQAWTGALQATQKAVGDTLAAQVKDGQKKVAAFTKLLQQQTDQGDPKGTVQKKLDTLADNLAKGLLKPESRGQIGGIVDMVQAQIDEQVRQAAEARARAEKDDELREEREFEALLGQIQGDRVNAMMEIHMKAARIKAAAGDKKDAMEILYFVFRESIEDQHRDKDYNLERMKDFVDLQRATTRALAGQTSSDPAERAISMAEFNMALNEMIATEAFAAVGTATNAGGAALSAAGQASRAAAGGMETAALAGGAAGAITGIAARSAADSMSETLDETVKTGMRTLRGGPQVLKQVKREADKALIAGLQGGVKGVFGALRIIGQMVQNQAGQVGDSQPTGGGNPVSDAIAGAAGFVEDRLAAALPVPIAFLSHLLGVGGLPDKVRSLILRIQHRVFAGVRETVAPMGRFLLVAVERVEGKLSPAVERIELLRGAVLRLQQALTDKTAQMAERVLGFTGRMKERAESRAAAIEAEVGETLAEFETRVGQAMAEIAEAAAKAEAEAEAIARDPEGAAEQSRDAVKEAIAAARQEAEEELQQAWVELREKLQEIPGWTRDRMAKAWTLVRDRLAEAQAGAEQRAAEVAERGREKTESKIEEAKLALARRWQEVRDEMAEAVEEAKAGVEKRVEATEADLSNQMDKLETGLTQMVAKGEAKIEKVVDEIENETLAVVEKIEIESQRVVSEVEAEVEKTAEEVETEIKQVADEVEAEVEETAAEVETEIGQVAEEIEAEAEKLAEMLEAEIEKVQEDAESVMEAKNEMMDAIVRMIQRHHEAQTAIIKSISA